MLFGIEYNSWSIDGQLNFDFDKTLTGEFCLDRTTEETAEFKRKNSLPDLFKVPILIISFLTLSWIYSEYFFENVDISSDLADLLIKILIGISVMGAAWLIIGVPRLFYRFPTKLVLRKTEIYLENIFGGKVFIISKSQANSINQTSEYNKTVYIVANLKDESVFLFPENKNENDILLNYFTTLGIECSFDLYTTPTSNQNHNWKEKPKIKYLVFILIIIAFISLGNFLNTQTDKNEFIVQMGGTEFLEIPLNNYKEYVNNTLENDENKLNKNEVFEGKFINVFYKEILKKEIDLALRNNYSDIKSINSFNFSSIDWKFVRRMTLGLTVEVTYENNKGEIFTRKEYFELGEKGRVVSVMDYDNQLQE